MAGKIKKLLENELVGGTQSSDVYPVTSVKAVYDEDNERLDNIIRRKGVVNISTNYNSDHIAEVLTLAQAIAKVPSNDRVLGFTMTFLSSGGWETYQFIGDSVSKWEDTTLWEALARISNGFGKSTTSSLSQNAVSNEFYKSFRTIGQSIIVDSELKFTEQNGYINSSGIITQHDSYKTKVYTVTPRSVVCVHGAQRGTPYVGVYALYNSKGVDNNGLIFVRTTNDYSNITEGAIPVRVNDTFVVPDDCKNIAVSYVVSEGDNGLYSVRYLEDELSNINNSIKKGITTNSRFNSIIKEIYVIGADRGTVAIKSIHRQGGDSTGDTRGYIVGQVGDVAYNIVLEYPPRVADADNNIIKATAGSATIYFLIDWQALDPGTGVLNSDFYTLSDDAYTLSANPQIANYLATEFHPIEPKYNIEGKYIYQSNGNVLESTPYNIWVYPVTSNRKYRIKGELHGTTTFAIYSDYSDGELSGLLYLFSKDVNGAVPIDEIIQGYNGYLAVSWDSLDVDVSSDGQGNIFSDVEDLQFRLAANTRQNRIGYLQGYINSSGSFVEHNSYTADNYSLIAGEKYRILGTYRGVKSVATLSFWRDEMFIKTILNTNAIVNVGDLIDIDYYFTVPLGVNKCYITNTYGNSLYLYKVDQIDQIDQIDLNKISVAGDAVNPDDTITSTYLYNTGELLENELYTVRKYNVEKGETFKVRGSTRGTKSVACYALYRGTEATSANLHSIYTIKDFVGSGYEGARQATIDHYISIPDTVVMIVTCSVPGDQNDMLLYNIANTKDYIDSKHPDTLKYVDCLGDSLTMGATRFGWYEDTLQELLGSGYKVRNWGVGGESPASIMARQGSDCIKFQEDWVLKADMTPTLVMDTDGGNITIKTQKYDKNVALLLQGAENDSGQQSRVVNPCYINGIKCTMNYQQGSGYSKGKWYIKRNEAGDRDITIPKNTPVYFNTGREMGKSDITIIWMGTNDGTYSDWQDLVDKQVMAANKVSNKKFIVIGLHKIGKTAGEDYEALMRNTFGNKFFNIREYMCTNMIYDAGMTPTEDDLSKMAAGDCPSSLLYDGTHLKPASNVALGKMLYNICVGLGYV